MVFSDVRCADRKAMMGTLLLSIRLEHNLSITQNKSSYVREIMKPQNPGAYFREPCDLKVHLTPNFFFRSNKFPYYVE